LEAEGVDGVAEAWRNLEGVAAQREVIRGVLESVRVRPAGGKGAKRDEVSRRARVIFEWRRF
jgi:hypothetical protein